MFKEHNSSHTSPIGERPLDVPKEIWRLVDHIYNFGMNQVCDTQYHIFVDSTVFSTASYFAVKSNKNPGLLYPLDLLSRGGCRIFFSIFRGLLQTFAVHLNILQTKQNNI